MPRIMIVDDVASIRQICNKVFQDVGYQVTEAARGEEALDLAKLKRVHLVITDVNMPGMNGIDLVQSLRALPDCKFIPILVLTTEAGAELKQKGKTAGATGWIVKPFDPQVLLDTLKKVL